MRLTNRITNKSVCFNRALQFFVLCCIVFQIFCTNGLIVASEKESVQYYKMISVVEYSGKSQFRNQEESIFTVRREALSGNSIRYTLSQNDLNPSVNQQDYQQIASSFILDKNTHRISGNSEDMAYWAKVNNQSVRSLKKVSKADIGKTWKQTIELSSLGGALPNSLSFTLTAIDMNTDTFGDMIAVRALSEPFIVKFGDKSVRSRINTVYLFDPQIEDVYLSVSVFDGETSSSGFNETLRYEIATYKTDASGASVNMSGLGGKFQRLVSKLGLSSEKLKVVKEAPLPRWAQSEGLTAAQVANICAAVACEGSVNPVVTICLPAARMIGLQSVGQIPSIGAFAKSDTVAGSLVDGIPGFGGMKIAPSLFGIKLGWNWGTAALVGAGVGIGVAINEANDDDSHHHASPH